MKTGSNSFSILRSSLSLPSPLSSASFPAGEGEGGRGLGVVAAVVADPPFAPSAAAGQSPSGAERCHEPSIKDGEHELLKLDLDVEELLLCDPCLEGGPRALLAQQPRGLASSATWSGQRQTEP